MAARAAAAARRAVALAGGGAKAAEPPRQGCPTVIRVRHGCRLKLQRRERPQESPAPRERSARCRDEPFPLEEFPPHVMCRELMRETRYP